MTHKIHPKPRRSTIGLIGSVAFMAFATGSVAAQPVEIEPPTLKGTPQVTTTYEPATEGDNVPDVYFEWLTDLRPAHEIDVPDVYFEWLTDLRPAHEIDVPDAYESMIADLREAAGER